MLDRRQEQARRRREHIAELNKRASEAGMRLKRLYDAIESGVADLSDLDLKERIAGLQALRDQSQADAERATTMLNGSSQQSVTPEMVGAFAEACTSRETPWSWATSTRWCRRRSDPGLQAFDGDDVGGSCLTMMSTMSTP